jgi:hypothetical protein
MPPNVPPGFLGERAPDFRKVDDEGSHGMNAGVIQEWTAETTVLIVLLVYFFFFPAAYVILWRSRRLPRNQKIGLSIVMALGLLYFGWLLVSGR